MAIGQPLSQQFAGLDSRGHDVGLFFHIGNNIIGFQGPGPENRQKKSEIKKMLA
jgi:hypothetical protein